MRRVSRRMPPVALAAVLVLAAPAFAQQPQQAQPQPQQAQPQQQQLQQQPQQQQSQMPMQAPAWPHMPQAMQPGGQGYQGPMGQGGWMQHGPMHQGMAPGWMQQGGQQGPGPMMPPGGRMAGPGYGTGYGPGPMMGGQSPMMGGPGMGYGRGQGMMHGRSCPMMGGRGCPMMGMNDGDDGNQPPFIAGRIAFLRAELGITDAQQPAFEELAGAMRRMYESAQAARMAMHGGAQQMGSPPERLGARISAMESRLLAMKGLKQALDKLYASFTDEQRQRANHALHFGIGRML